ncbi:hypothetical protein ACLESD_00385 [Pyxidicoccus sp. 3LFB2]
MKSETASPQTFDPSIAAQVQSRRRFVSVIVYAWMALVVLSYVSPWPEKYGDLAYKVTTGVMLASMIPLFWKWRCPRCNKFLGGAANPKFCAGCGVPFVAP